MIAIVALMLFAITVMTLAAPGGVPVFAGTANHFRGVTELVDKFQDMIDRGLISLKGGKAPQGPSQADLDRQAEAERKAKEAEDAANEKVSASSRASYNSRTGRRLLLAPGREDKNATLGSNNGTSGGSF
jgi:hypothetical protein